MIRVSMNPGPNSTECFCRSWIQATNSRFQLRKELRIKYSDDKKVHRACSGEVYISSLVHFRDFVEPNASYFKWPLFIYSTVKSKNVIVSTATEKWRRYWNSLLTGLQTAKKTSDIDGRHLIGVVNGLQSTCHPKNGSECRLSEGNKT